MPVTLADLHLSDTPQNRYALATVNAINTVIPCECTVIFIDHRAYLSCGHLRAPGGYAGDGSEYTHHMLPIDAACMHPGTQPGDTCTACGRPC